MHHLNLTCDPVRIQKNKQNSDVNRTNSGLKRCNHADGDWDQRENSCICLRLMGVVPALCSCNEEVSKMDNDNIIKRIYDIGILPVIDSVDPDNAVRVAKSICKGGLPVTEVSYRNDAVQNTMIEMKRACPGMLIGAGNIFSGEQIDSVLGAGADFITTLGLHPDLVRYCQSRNIPVIPGVSDESEIDAAISMELDTVKFFLSENSGGIRKIKALSAAYGKIKFIPAGGITENDISGYLNEPCVLACCGSWMIDENAIAEKNFEKITELTGRTVNSMLGLTIKHIGINEENGDGASLAGQFAGIFGGRVRETFKGWFGSEYVEVMSKKFTKGRRGHIGIGVNDPDRARRYYEAQGYSFDDSTAGYDENGDLEIIYFSGEIGGFALHIVKK